MTENQKLLTTIFEGWSIYQETVIEALRPLNQEQLALRADPKLRSVGEIASHIIGARARWFYSLIGEGGEDIRDLGKWDRRGEKVRSSEELINGLERSWQGMQGAINSWSAEEWQQSFPGEDDSEPEVITLHWVIWHLIEHDLHHGGEISLTLGAHGISALDL